MHGSRPLVVFLYKLDRKCCMSSQPENYTDNHDHHRKNE
uniref:Uncharacterized protein n=1 Tax=Salmonella enterica TaxID=28901 RepID=A0A4D6IXF9_SALER|nr:hypothetical protein [Salmonella enterica]